MKARFVLNIRDLSRPSILDEDIVEFDLGSFILGNVLFLLCRVSPHDVDCDAVLCLDHLLLFDAI